MIKFPLNVHRLIDLAVEEDLGTGDVTGKAILDENAQGEAVILARQELVLCGLDVAREVYRRIGAGVVLTSSISEGQTVGQGAVLAELTGPVTVLLTGERIALNFLQRLCGIATLAGRYAAAAGGRTTILDSRKTVPGWRWLDKMAVRVGGCTNHRMGLFDGILIKDNHIAASGGIPEALARARERAPAGMEIEIEVEDLDGVREAMENGADIIMLDNFDPPDVVRAVRINAGKARLELSGGIDLTNLGEYLDAAGLGSGRGVDFISIGALTHSAPAADIAMEIRSGNPAAERHGDTGTRGRGE
ncbi:MAG: carboxylating nicotinate-nucleotide diphosphorylase [bacterium]|nr:carboxylating nicotinate-nucleotide diphosphorylase [bacterium]